MIIINIKRLFYDDVEFLGAKAKKIEVSEDINKYMPEKNVQYILSSFFYIPRYSTPVEILSHMQPTEQQELVNLEKVNLLT